MFSGIVEEYAHVVGVVREQENLHLTLRCSFVDELKIDQSISHNGVCLTVVRIEDGTYTVTAMRETIERSNIGLLKVGDKVNVERSMRLDGRLDGHIVQGHVDMTARCLAVDDADGSWYYTFEYDFNPDMARRGYFTVDKGSVTVNGVESVRYEYTSPLAGGTYYFTGGKVTGDMKIEVELYCAIFPVFTNLDQSVQANSGVYVPVGLSFVAGLGRIFGSALQYGVTAPADFDPDDPYGIYTVTAKMTGDYAEDFPLIARDESGNITDGSAAELRVRYFENAGTEEEEYLVGTLYDFMMIDRYLDPSDKGASAFGYYGGGTRYFRQTADIFFDNSFTGLIRAFDGVYDGDGYRFSAEEIEVPASSFKAIFSSVKGGRILNLKAEIFRYEISAGGSFAVVAGTVTDNAALLDMYIAANVYIDGAEVSFGGAAAEVQSSTIVNSFAAVNIFIDGAYGSVGGFAG